MMMRAQYKQRGTNPQAFIEAVEFRKSRIQAMYSLEQIKDAVGAAVAGERAGKILIVSIGL